jgi:hypothetical protein
MTHNHLHAGANKQLGLGTRIERPWNPQYAHHAEALRWICQTQRSTDLTGADLGNRERETKPPIVRDRSEEEKLSIHCLQATHVDLQRQARCATRCRRLA